MKARSQIKPKSNRNPSRNQAESLKASQTKAKPKLGLHARTSIGLQAASAGRSSQRSRLAESEAASQPARLAFLGLPGGAREGTPRGKEKGHKTIDF